MSKHENENNLAAEEQATEKTRRPHYTVRPVLTPIKHSESDAEQTPGTPQVKSESAAKIAAQPKGNPQVKGDPFIRAASEDDDGYDPFSDRPPAPEPTYQEDPWR